MTKKVEEAIRSMMEIAEDETDGVFVQMLIDAAEEAGSKDAYGDAMKILEG